MEIVKIENFDEMTANNVYYELDGKFYARCWTCGKPVAVDHHRTASDLRREEESEEVYFCDKTCKSNHDVFCDEDDQNVNYSK